MINEKRKECILNLSGELYSPCKGYMNAEWQSHHQGESSALDLRCILSLALNSGVSLRGKDIRDKKSGVNNDVQGTMHVFQNNRSIWLEQQISINKPWKIRKRIGCMS